MAFGGFSWKRALGISAAKARLSRKIGIPLTQSGRDAKLGRTMRGAGAFGFLLIGLLASPIVLIAALFSAGDSNKKPSHAIAPAPTPRAANSETQSLSSEDATRRRLEAAGILNHAPVSASTAAPLEPITFQAEVQTTEAVKPPKPPEDADTDADVKEATKIEDLLEALVAEKVFTQITFNGGVARVRVRKSFKSLPEPAQQDVLGVAWDYHYGDENKPAKTKVMILDDETDKGIGTFDQFNGLAWYPEPEPAVAQLSRENREAPQSYPQPFNRSQLNRPGPQAASQMHTIRWIGFMPVSIKRVNRLSHPIAGLSTCGATDARTEHTLSLTVGENNNRFSDDTGPAQTFHLVDARN